MCMMDWDFNIYSHTVNDPSGMFSHSQYFSAQRYSTSSIFFPKDLTTKLKTGVRVLKKKMLSSLWPSTEHFLYAKHYVIFFISINSLNPHKNPMSRYHFSFYKWESWALIWSSGSRSQYVSEPSWNPGLIPKAYS